MESGNLDLDLETLNIVNFAEEVVELYAQLAQEKNIDVILIGVPKPGLFLKSSKIYHAVAEQTGVLLLDDLLPEILSDASLKYDHVHPNEAGYRKMAQTLVQTMKEAHAL